MPPEEEPNGEDDLLLPTEGAELSAAYENDLLFELADALGVPLSWEEKEKLRINPIGGAPERKPAADQKPLGPDSDTSSVSNVGADYDASFVSSGHIGDGGEPPSGPIGIDALVAEFENADMFEGSLASYPVVIDSACREVREAVTQRSD